MTVEIKQLIVRAVVTADRPMAAPQLQPQRGAAPAQPEQRALAASAEDRDELVAACVREVLRELKKARER